MEDTAKAIAVVAHQGQTRKFGPDKGKPYIIHPERVAAMVYADAQKAAAWLHDTIEDTSTTIEDLRNFGITEEVVDIVKAVTRRDGETYFDFIWRIKGVLPAIDVKVADLLDNASTLREGSLKDKYRLAYCLLTGRKPPF